MSIEWRVVHPGMGWNTFNTDPLLDGLRALSAFLEACAEDDQGPTLHCRQDGGDWIPPAPDDVDPVQWRGWSPVRDFISSGSLTARLAEHEPFTGQGVVACSCGEWAEHTSDEDYPTHLARKLAA